MKVLVLSHISELVGGAEKSLLDVFDLWAEKHNIQPEFILRKPVGTLGTALEKRGWKYHELDYTFWSEAKPPSTADAIRSAALKNVRAVEDIEQIIKKTKPDIVLTNSVVCPWAALAAYRQKVPHVWFVREHGDLDHGRIFEQGRKKTLNDVGNLSALVAANSKALASHLGKYIPKEKITVCYNPFNIEEIKNRAAEKVRNPYKQKDSLKLVLVSGSLTESKGALQAVEATGKLNAKGLAVELCLIGRQDDKDYLGQMKKAIKDYNVASKVHFVGWQPNPLAYMNLADVGIMASRLESFGRVTFEFIALGKPVVGTNRGGTTEMIDNGINGYLYNRGNVDELVACLKNYARDKKLIKTHGQKSEQKAKEIINSEYNADNLFKKVEAIAKSKQLPKTAKINYEQKLADNLKKPKYKPVSIIIPVYGDWPSLNDCIESLKKHVDTKEHKVMLVNDCGPEADLLEKNIKKAIKGHRGFEYFRNPKNLGFIQNCNRAVMELDKTENDVLLLNSDTKVTEGFLEEMVGVLNSADKIGVVSPRSNNATIATVPLWSIHQKGINPKKSYKIFQKIKTELPRYSIAPVGHGFCMLIKRNLIKKYGLFDEVFGKGYGEEVDFCLRIKKHGYLSVLSNHSYVFHLEARSFTLETKSKLLEQNNKIIWKRYPTYRQSVRDYIEDALQQEGKVDLRTNPKQILKKTIKRNQKLYNLARKLRRS